MDKAESEQTGSGNARDNPSAAVSEPAGLDEQKKAYDELNDRFLRLAADFDNYRKRVLREQESAILHANERFAVDLLEVVDNFDRALKSDDSHLREGLVQIRDLLDIHLRRHGVTPIDSLRNPFNPAEHEAVAHIPSDEPEGTVVDEITKGYRLNEKIIRHAKVAVSKGNAENVR